MKPQLLLVAMLIPMAGCALNDFAQKQADWNRKIGMPDASAIGGPSASERAAAEREAETQHNIKMGEDVENEEARKAGFGPSPTEGMTCTRTATSSGTPVAMTSTSTMNCHN